MQQLFSEDVAVDWPMGITLGIQKVGIKQRATASSQMLLILGHVSCYVGV
jgi:hypothetical protein